MGDTALQKSTPTHGDSELKGWLFKWTNYIKGYQKRWFVLSNGLLSYYRNQAEMAHTCRGTISLNGALIHTVDPFTFVISNGGTQTFHIKASSEVERNNWVTALELAKAKAIRAMESDDEDNENPTGELSNDDLQAILSELNGRLDHLKTCSDLINKHWQALQRSLNELEQTGDLQIKNKAVSERATLFRIASKAMINACTEYVSVAQTHVKWYNKLANEREQRLQLEEMIEQLARQESYDKSEAARRTSGETQNDDNVDEENEFFDCLGESHSIGNVDRNFSSNKFDGELNKSGNVGSSQKNTFILKIPISNTSQNSKNVSEGSEGSSSDTDERHHQHRNTKSLLFITGGNFDSNTLSNVIREKDTAENSAYLTPQIESSQDSFPNASSKKRRTTIPEKPNYPMNLWCILKNCIGKDISKIPMPVNFCEPLSMLQRLTEDYEYSDLLDRAAKCSNPFEQLAYVAAFTITQYASTSYRTNKPFNPLLGETYECDRNDDFGWRCINEQVSHHPPMVAQHCEGKSWICWQEFTMSAKFRGKYLQIIPSGSASCEFPASGNKFTWRKVNTTVHNIIVGKLWVDQEGDMEIIGHGPAQGLKCLLKYVPYSYFTKDSQRRVKGCVMNEIGKVQYVINGIWDSKIDIAQVTGNTGTEDQPVFQTGPYMTIWRVKPLPQDAEKCYYFSTFACQLNEMEDGIAPTDSRLRPDQLLLENGKWNEANEEKIRLEEKQRLARRQREKDAERAANLGEPFPPYQPNWFKQEEDKHTGQVVHKYGGEYWECKAKQDWTRCPDLF